MFISQLENSDKLHCCPFFFFSFWYNYWTNNNIGKNSNSVNIVPVQKHMSQDVVRKHQYRQRWQLLLLFHWLLNLLQPADKLLSLPVSDASIQHPHDWFLWRGEQTDESSSCTWHKYHQIEWLFMSYWRSNWKPRPTHSGLPRSQYYVCVKQTNKKLIQPGATCTAGFTARQVENDRLDALAGCWGCRSPRPTEVAERSHGFTGEVVGGKPVIIHHSEGQTGKPVSVLFRTDVAGRHRDQTNQP